MTQKVDINLKTIYDILFAVEKKKQYSNIAINNFINKNSATKPALIREIVYGVLENKYLLDYKISQLIKGKLKDVRPQDLIILRSGVYQIDEIDSMKQYTVVDESVKLAKKYAKGRDKFINAILQKYTREKENLKILPKSEKINDIINFWKIKYSFEPWIIKLFVEQFGKKETEEILLALNKKPNFCIRTNINKISREKLVTKLEQYDIKALESSKSGTAIRIIGKNLVDNELYNQGYYSVQDESSQILVEEMEIQKDLVVVDVCAAPGGKTFAIAEKMMNTGVVYSRDIYENKIKGIEAGCKRLGLTSIQTKIWSGDKMDNTLINKCDRVLCDVPCSGLGVVSKKPEIKYKKNEKEVEKLPEIQFNILNTSANYLKDNGILIYSTCTINRKENEDVVEKFLKENSKFRLKKQILLMPNKDDTDGFFIAKIVKEA